LFTFAGAGAGEALGLAFVLTFCLRLGGGSSITEDSSLEESIPPSSLFDSAGGEETLGLAFVLTLCLRLGGSSATEDSSELSSSAAGFGVSCLSDTDSCSEGSPGTSDNWLELSSGCLDRDLVLAFGDD
jgi:hypothetical protein